MTISRPLDHTAGVSFGSALDLTGPPGPQGEQGQPSDVFIVVTEPPYNAVGDGATDDTAAIQAALTAAAGGTVYIPGGTYLTNDLAVGADTRIVGEGPTSILKLKAGAANCNIFMVTANNVTFENLKLDGNRANVSATGRGLISGSGKFLTYRNVTAIDSSGFGLQIWGGSYGRILDCTVIDSEDVGITTTISSGGGPTEDAIGHEIAGNLVDRTGIAGASIVGHGIAAHTASGAYQLRHLSIHDNRILMPQVDNNTGNGIEIWGYTLGTNGPHNSTIADNVIKGGQFAISCASAHSCTIAGNVIYKPNVYGIEIASSDYCACTGNTIDGASAPTRGIVVNNEGGSHGKSTVITGNTVKGCTSDGIIVDGPGATITGNTVEQGGSPSTGITVLHQSGLADNVTISGNEINCLTTCDQAIQLTNVPYSVVTGNILRDYTTRGVLHYATTAITVAGIVENNLFHSGAGTPIVSNFSGGAVYGEMRCDGNTGIPIPSTGSGATVTLPIFGDIQTISGTADITSITASYPGRRVTLIFSGTAATNGVVDGSNLKLAGNFVYTPDDTITLLCDGTNWIEAGRSVN